MLFFYENDYVLHLCFHVETAWNVLELRHYVIRNLWIVLSHVTTFLSGAILVHITCIKTNNTKPQFNSDNKLRVLREVFCCGTRSFCDKGIFITRIH